MVCTCTLSNRETSCILLAGKVPHQTLRALSELMHEVNYFIAENNKSSDVLIVLLIQFVNDATLPGVSIIMSPVMTVPRYAGMNIQDPFRSEGILQSSSSMAIRWYPSCTPSSSVPSIPARFHPDRVLSRSRPREILQSLAVSSSWNVLQACPGIETPVDPQQDSV